MRTFLFAFLLFSTGASAQINRSANELARETTAEFVQKKLFKDQAYTPVSYGEIKSYHDKGDLSIEWVIEHRFEIGQRRRAAGKTNEALKQPYKFTFFLDHEMKVRKAELFQSTM